MANEKRLIDYRKATEIVLNELKGKITATTAVMLVSKMKYATVDAVEVVHAEWIDEYPYVRCSECNAEWINCRTDNEPKLFYYCPNCGADMRERKNESC